MKRKFLRLFFLGLLVLSLCLSVTACGDQTEKGTPPFEAGQEEPGGEEPGGEEPGGEEPGGEELGGEEPGGEEPGGEEPGGEEPGGEEPGGEEPGGEEPGGEEPGGEEPVEEEPKEDAWTPDYKPVNGSAVPTEGGEPEEDGESEGSVWWDDAWSLESDN